MQRIAAALLTVCLVLLAAAAGASARTVGRCSIPNGAHVVAKDRQAIAFEAPGEVPRPRGQEQVFYHFVLDGCLLRVGHLVRLVRTQPDGPGESIGHGVARAEQLQLVGTRVSFVYFWSPGGIYTKQLEQVELRSGRHAMLSSLLRGGDTGYARWVFREIDLRPSGDEAWVLGTETESSDQYLAQLFARGSRSRQSQLLASYSTPLVRGDREEMREGLLQWLARSLTEVSITGSRVSWAHEGSALSSPVRGG
jgi:hypothetical protein